MLELEGEDWKKRKGWTRQEQGGGGPGGKDTRGGLRRGAGIVGACKRGARSHEAPLPIDACHLMKGCTAAARGSYRLRRKLAVQFQLRNSDGQTPGAYPPKPLETG